MDSGLKSSYRIFAIELSRLRTSIRTLTHSYDLTIMRFCIACKTRKSEKE